MSCSEGSGSLAVFRPPAELQPTVPKVNRRGDSRPGPEETADLALRSAATGLFYQPVFCVLFSLPAIPLARIILWQESRQTVRSKSEYKRKHLGNSLPSQASKEQNTSRKSMWNKRSTKVPVFRAPSTFGLLSVPILTHLLYGKCSLFCLISCLGDPGRCPPDLILGTGLLFLNSLPKKSFFLQGCGSTMHTTALGLSPGNPQY